MIKNLTLISMIVAANLALTACSPETTAALSAAVEDFVSPEVGVKPTTQEVKGQKDNIEAVAAPGGTGLKDFVNVTNTIDKPAKKQSQDGDEVTTPESTSTNMDDLLTLDTEDAVATVYFVDFAINAVSNAIDIAREENETIPDDNIWSECDVTVDEDHITINDCEGTLKDNDSSEPYTVYMEGDLTFNETESDTGWEFDVNGEIYFGLIEQDESFFVMGLESLNYTISGDSANEYVEIDTDLLIVEYDAEDDTSISGWMGLETNGDGLMFAPSDEDGGYVWMEDALSGSIELEDETETGVYTVTFNGNGELTGTIGSAQ